MSTNAAALLLWTILGILSLASGQINLFPRPIPLQGTRNSYYNATALDGGHYSWEFDQPKIDEMIYVAFTGDYINDNINVAGYKTSYLRKQFPAKCYMFAHPNQTDTRCSDRSASENCHYVKYQTKAFKIVYKSEEKPKFGFQYIFTNCHDTGDSNSKPTPTTRPPRTTKSPDVRIVQPSFTQPQVKDKDQTTASQQTTPDDDDVTRRSENDQNTIIIVVIIASVVFALIVLLLLFCGLRYSRYREQMKQSRVQFENGTRKSNPIPPVHESLYEEIVPALPARNPNMQDPQYEIPMCAQKYGRNEAAIHSETKSFKQATDEPTELPPTDEQDTSTVNVLYNMQT